MENKNNHDEPIKWAGVFNEFLWICAGVNRRLLRQCPTDYAKYAGIGGTILFTALMAMLSGGYALNSVFDKAGLAIAFGVFWGLLIFNLDRFIVNTMYSDGKVTISWRELGAGLPRIIMAVFLGIVISTPLELKVFEDAIDIRIEQDKENFLKELIADTIQERDSIAKKKEEKQNGVHMFDTGITTSSITTNNLLSEVKELESQLVNIKAKIKSDDGKINRLQQRLNSMPGNSSSWNSIMSGIRNAKITRNEHVREKNAIETRIRNKNGEITASNAMLNNLMGSKQRETEKECDRLQNAVDSLNKVISEAYTRHQEWTKDEIKERGSFKDKLDVEYNGFQARMTAFGHLKEESRSAFLSSIFIMILFVIIETAPTFFKMMIASGPYDDLLRAEMHRVRVLSDKSINEINEQVNYEMKISTAKNEERLAAELKANGLVLEKLSKAQSELIENAIKEWKEQELAKIKANPSTYINSSVQPQ